MTTDIQAPLFDEDVLPPSAPRILSLVERFVVPPFSVFDARQGYWQERKAAWLAMGIQSELGRDAPSYNMQVDGSPIARAGGRRGTTDGGGGAPDTIRDPNFYNKKKAAEARVGRTLSLEEFRADFYQDVNDVAAYAGGTSIFDPVLAECVYRWYCPRGGLVLDPFAGGSVRGIVAGVLGRHYYGIDLSAPQIAANAAQGAAMLPWLATPPTWRAGDSRDVLAGIPRRMCADLMFTCPPYFDLEVYSDDPRDLSAMGDYARFLDAYGDILRMAVGHLRPDSFAAIVVGNVRAPDGTLRNLVADTAALMRAAGASYYNEAVLLTAIGSASVRAYQFAIGRKLVRVHQSLLIFVKGDSRRAADRCGAITAADAGVIEVPGDGQTELAAPR